MFPRRLLGLLSVAAAASVAVAACAGGDEEAASGPSGIPTFSGATSTSTAVPTARPQSTATATSAPATPTAAPEASSPSPAPTSPPSGGATAVTQPTPAPQPSAVTLRFRAFDNAFDRTSARVRAGSTVTAIMQNDEVGVAHNLSFSLPGLAHGDTCSGPCTTTQTFEPAAAGSFFFLCTIHDMSGTFIVDP